MIRDVAQQSDLSQRQAQLQRENTAVLMPSAPGKDQKSRLGFFIDWLTRADRHWYQPDLRAYRDFLLHERARTNKRNQVKAATLSPQTALAHLATIRARYAQLSRSEAARESLFDIVANPEASNAEQRAMVDEFFLRLAFDVHPQKAPIPLVEIQDRADSEHLRLKPYQVSALLGAPGIGSLRGLRDTALMTLMVCTGIRAAEAAALHVDDLRQQLGGELSLRVRDGKGGKQRLIPYGPLNWCLMYVDAWQRDAQIKAGPVFRRILKGNRAIGAKGIGAWTVNDIMNKYPISIDGELRLVKPHDLRRTYARNAYDFGMDLERIRQNLGHASLQTTQTYIGALDGRDRHPPNMFHPPHEMAQLHAIIGQ